jgi:hypothetical protein
MHAVLAAVIAADEIDPATVRPSPLASIVFVFLLAATILLLWSFVRHLRRVDSNLGPARRLPGGQQPGGPGVGAGSTGEPGQGEGGTR